MSGIRLLHVDDDPALLELAETVLDRTAPELDVVTATRGEAALDALDDGIDCVVSDYEMPGMDGLELLAAVRERRPDLPFVLFTGKGSEEIASEAISAGVTDYLQKGAGTEQYTVLANRVRNAVERHRAQQAVEARMAAVDAATDAIGILDESATYTYVNDAHRELFGYDPDDLVGADWTAVYPETEVDRLRGPVTDVLAAEGEWSGEAVAVRPDGTRVPHELTITRTADGYVGVASETAEPSLRYERLLENLPGMVYRCRNEPGWPMEFVSEGCERLTGYEPSTLESGEVVWGEEVIHPDDRDDLWPIVQAAVDAREPFRLDYRIETRDGETRWFWEQGRGVFEGEELVALEGFITDVTARRRVRERLRERTERLDSFVDVVTHDIRNPLQVARGELESLDEPEADRARTAVDRMADLLDEVADLARGVEPDREWVSLRSAAVAAWDTVDTADASISIVDATAVEADRDALIRVFENLFANAVEHGGPAVSIEVGTLGDDPGFYVADDGPGVQFDDATRAFEPGVSTADDGTGYGLANVEQVADAHGWTVGLAESAAGGARIEVAGVDERSMTEPV